MKKLLALPAVLLILAAAGVVGVFGFRYLVSAPSTDSRPLSVTISKGESVAQIADRLEKNGLVRNALVYRIFVRLSGFETKIQAGTFKLSQDLPMKDLTYRLTRGTTDQAVTTLEGWRIEEIAEYLEKKQIVTKDEFLEAAATGKFDYGFLPSYSGSLDHPYRRLEGYLFPDTYQIAAQTSAETVINIMLQNFRTRVDSKMRSDAAAEKLSLAEVINLAAVVEREARHDQDRAVVAGILIKRYQTPGHRLEADATVQFAAGTSGNWWTPLQDLARNIKSDSPYNTYTHDGLPPTPIASPGLASIKAAVYPQSSDYWFYVADSKGVMHYAKTLDEQTANIQKYNIH